MEEIERVVEILQSENDVRAATDPLTKKSLAIVEHFLKHHPVMCYGGTAINNLLPPSDRFYDPRRDVPDYDFFSKTPQEHAMRLANQLSGAGIKNIEVKPGIHLGTFKVFADFEGIADITYLEPPIFDKLWKADLVRGDIHYVPPDFLRMSMYLELSRPRGDVSRWIKVFGRLMLLNKHYPIVCKGEGEPHTALTPERKREVKKLLKNPNVVLLGAEPHTREEWTVPVTLLATREFLDEYIKGKKVKTTEDTEILPSRISIVEEDGSCPIHFYETIACHSFHRLPDGTKVASIPTVLSFLFAYLYADPRAEPSSGPLLCVAQKLVDIAHSKPKRRFELLTPMECLGTQQSLLDMRKEKAKLYDELSANKNSAEFVKYFFTYNPNVDKTQKKRARTLLRKTRRARQRN